MPNRPPPNTVDTLRLSAEEHAAVIATLHRNQEEAMQGGRRAHHRQPYRGRPVTVTLTQTGGTVTSFSVKPHNVSCGGISFLHGNFVHTGSTCRLTLRALDGTETEVAGRVVRCRLIRGRVHEVGVAFDSPIDLGCSLPSLDNSDNASSSERVPRFLGRLLYVDVAARDEEHNERSELLGAMVAEFGLHLDCSHDVESATRRLVDGTYDLVLVHLPLPTGAPNPVAGLRRCGYAGPLVALLDRERAAEDAVIQEEATAWRAGCDCVLASPITFERLGELFADYLLRDYDGNTEGQVLVSLHWSKTRMRPLILRFVSRLPNDLRTLDRLIQAGQEAGFHQGCRRLTSAAETYGYPAVAKALRELGEMAEKGVGPDGLRAQFEVLAALSTAARRGCS